MKTLGTLEEKLLGFKNKMSTKVCTLAKGDL